MNEEEYWRALRAALRTLYDHAALRKNALNPLFAPHMQGLSLQEVLLEAVQALSPLRGAAVQSDAHRTHQILQHRYVEQFSQGEVADSMGLSERQLRRQEQLAIRTLGEYLRVRYALPVEVQAPSALESAPAEFEDAEAGESVETGDAEHYQQEMERLHQATPLEVLDVGEMIEGVIDTLQPLLLGMGISIECVLHRMLPGVTANAMALRQALMIALSAIARAADGRSIFIETQSESSRVKVTLRAESKQGESTLEKSESLAMARQLLALSAGDLSVRFHDGWTDLTLSLAVEGAQVRTYTVLIIDDNQDSLQLCLRYLSGTAYQCVLAHDPVEGLALAEEVAPQVVLLDVMMPGMDGWEMLARLRRHPATENIPVVIFTILPEEPLAIALGAFGFLRKPFTREELLEAVRSATNARP